MHPEDIVRIRESQEIDHLKLESEKLQLINELKLVIKKKSIVATARFNNVLQQAIKLIKNS